MTNALLHPFAPVAKPESDFVNMVRGEGSIVWDDTGRDYVDGLASLWYCQVGYGQTRIIDAVTAQMRQMVAYNVFDPFTNGPASRVAEMIAERSPHPDGRVFLGCSGSEAVDTAPMVTDTRISACSSIVVFEPTVPRMKGTLIVAALPSRNRRFVSAM